MIGRALGTVAGKLVAGALVATLVAGVGWWIVDLIGDRRELRLRADRLAENVETLKAARERDQLEILNVTDAMRMHRERAKAAQLDLEKLRARLAQDGGDAVLGGRVHRFRLRLERLTRPR